MKKVRASITTQSVMLSADMERVVSSKPVAGEMILLTAEEIYKSMSQDPGSLMPINPTAPSLSGEEKAALDELYSLFIEGAESEDCKVKKNCLEIISSPFGLLHPRRIEGVSVLKKAAAPSDTREFVEILIQGSIQTLEQALNCGHKETEETARKLIELLR